MVKKALVSVFVLGISAVLVAGAINRTSSKAAQLAEGEPVLTGRGRQGTVASEAGGANGSSQGQGRGKQTVGTTEALPASTNGGGKGTGNGFGNGNNPSDEGQSSAGAVDPTASFDYAGVVLAVGDDGLSILLESGEELLIEGRAWRYALELGFETQPGAALYLDGFFEEGEFKVVSITDLNTLDVVILRSDTDQPMWAGRNGRSA